MTPDWPGSDWSPTFRILWDPSGIEPLPKRSRWWYVKRWFRWNILRRFP